MEITCIAQTPRESTDEEEEEGLDGADPGDLRWGPAEMGDVVGLKDAE